MTTQFSWFAAFSDARQGLPIHPNWAAQQSHPFDPERAYMEYIKEFVDRQKRIAALPDGWFEPAAEWNKIP